MDLSVLIVTYQSRRHIADCLRSLAPALHGLESEVVVIDNASTDGTLDAAAAACPRARRIALPENRGFAGGLKAGLAGSTGRYLLWLNPDATFVNGRVRDVIAWMEAHPGVGVVGGRVLDPDGGVQRSARTFPSYGAVLGARYSVLTRLFPRNPFSRKFLRSDSSYRDIEPVDWVSGAFLLHSREISERLGGPDDGFFMYFEDVDFCYRAWRAGSQVYFHPGITIEHRIGGSSSQRRAALLVARHRSLWRWYAKHFHRFWLKDAAVWAGIWIRCAALIAASFAARRHSDA